MEQADTQIQAASRQLPTLRPLELQLLGQMEEVAGLARHLSDPRVEYLKGWIRQHQRPQVGTAGAPRGRTRVIIFTEYSDTKEYLQYHLERFIEGSDQSP